MSFKRCPGSSSITQPKPDLVACPECKAEVEIWSDEATGQCPDCSCTVIRTETQSCVDWCRYAKECLGDDKFVQYRQMKATMRKPVLMAAVEERLQGDVGRVGKSSKGVAYAESILTEERDADPMVVIAGTAMHELAAEDVTAILLELGFAEQHMRAVRDAIAAQPRGEDAPLDHRVVHDALLLTAYDAGKAAEPENPHELVARFLTPKGRRIARELAPRRSSLPDT